VNKIKLVRDLIKIYCFL